MRCNFQKVMAGLGLLGIVFSNPCVGAEADANPALNKVKLQEKPSGGILELVKDGKSQASIVIAKDKFANHRNIELKAAKELQEHVKIATGAELPIVADNVKTEGLVILIGESELTRQLKIGIDGLRPEGFRVKTFEGGLAIVGTLSGPTVPGTTPNNQGVLFGVYDVLERYMGVRWYYPGEDGRVIPKQKDFTVPPVHYTDAPVRTLRVQLSGGDPTLFSRYRGGKSTSVDIRCHTPIRFDTLKPYPECLELDLSGNRNPGMPCYGNPKTAELFVQDVANFYEKGEKKPWLLWDNATLWGPPTDKVIYISPPDKGVSCSCEYCKKLFDPNADPLARASKIMCEYVVRVAELVKARWPDKTVYYLPYVNYTLPTEGLKLPDNVVVCVCLMYGVNEKEPKVAKAHGDMIRDWKKATGKKVFIWTYPCWPVEDTTLPFQYPHVMQAFEKAHLDDIEGEGLCGDYFAGQNPSTYCWWRLMWNPDFNVDAAITEFVNLMYGPAKEPMREIYATLTDRWEKIQWQKPLTSWHVSPKQINEETMPRKEALKLKALLAEARKLAGENTVERRRVNYFGEVLDKFIVESDRYHDGGGLAELKILKVGANPLVDGKLDDVCWKDAEKNPFKMAMDQKNPVPANGTTVQGVWTDKGVTFGFQLTESEMEKIRAKCTARDSDVYSDDCIEMFLDVTGERSGYCQLVVNSLGTVFDRSSDSEEWNATGCKTAISKGKDSWSMEVYLPFSDFKNCPPIKIGSLWYGNFTRSRYAGKPELQRWNTLFEASNLSFNAFGKLRFVE